MEKQVYLKVKWIIKNVYTYLLLTYVEIKNKCYGDIN